PRNFLQPHCLKLSEIVMTLSLATAPGAAPQQSCVSPLPSLTPPRLDYGDRSTLAQYFQNTWALEDWLMQTVVGEAPWYDQPDRLRNPLVFYLGHCPSFYVNKLHQAGLIDQPVDEALEHLFGIGVDPDTPAELEAVIGGLTWPSLAQVWAYRSQVRDLVASVIDRVDLDWPITPDSPLWALMMGLDHSRVHLETSSMLLRQLPPEQLQRPQDWTYAPIDRPAPTNDWRELSGGWVTLGKSWRDAYYGWDMEYGHRQVEVAPFGASTYLVSNQEFLAFVEAGGYRDPAYWDGKGWAWVQGIDRGYPAFWVPTGGSMGNCYGYRTVFEVIEMPWGWPVEVNHHEALAFCRWKGEGVRLMTEAEWTWAVGVSDSRLPDFWDLEAHNLNLQYGSPSTVGSLATAKSAVGLYDLRGNVWEWLGDPFNPLPGFEAHDLYPDHANLYFDAGHFMMMGGSWISNGAMAAPTYRNWFRPQFYQHAGFRLARDLA
ncbi:MAG: 5-histidylcysteine sulfoxide synthase, partial [Prochlorothrix sp.]